MDFSWVIPVFIGIGLSAATGIRVFLPFFLISLSKYLGWFTWGEQFAWLDNPLVLIALGVATAIEIAGYYIPLVDHILDVIITPLAYVAGVVSMTSILPEMPAYMDDILGFVVGGTTAVSLNSIMGLWRVKTTASTAGLASPVYATGENIAGVMFTMLAFLIPVIFGLLILVLVFSTVKMVRKFFKARKSPVTPIVRKPGIGRE